MSCYKCGTGYTTFSPKFCLKCGAKFTPTTGEGSAPTTPTKAPAGNAGTPTHTAPTTTATASVPAPSTTPTRPAVSAQAHAKEESPRRDGRFCHTCKAIIVGNVAEDSKGLIYHPACFKCNICSAPIVNAYTYDDKDRVTCDGCARQQLHLTGEDVCVRCGKGISGEAIFVVGSLRYHKACFTCVGCGVNVEGAPFTTTDKGILCKPCNLKEKGFVCCACGHLIEQGALKALDKIWHERCFECGKCKKTIPKGGQFYADAGQPLCANCVQGGGGPPSSSPVRSAPTPATSSAGTGGHEAPKAKFCGECGTPSSGGRFCADCGAPL